MAAAVREIIDETWPAELAHRFGEPDWMAAKRRESMGIFRDMPLPTIRDDGWRYTDPRKIRLDGLALPAVRGEKCDDDVRVKALDGFEQMAGSAGVMIHCNGLPGFKSLPKSWGKRGVKALDWQSAVREMPDFLAANFMTAVLPNTFDKFMALHGALIGEATIINVPDGVVLDEALFNIRWYSDAGRLNAPHTLIVLGQSAAIKVVEILIGPATDGMVVPAYEFQLEPDSSLKYVRLGQLSSSQTVLGYERAVLARDARLVSGVINLGGRLVRDVVHARMAGQGADARLLGAYFVGAGQHVHHETLQEHAVPRCHSDLLFKGALTGNGRSVFGGMIKVFPGAQKTDAYQKNRNLILSGEARADSIPQLEIRADDVKCSHGATISQVQESEMFYLMSRGLRHEAAEELLVFGFIDEVFAKLDWPDIIAPLECRISARIRR